MKNLLSVLLCSLSVWPALAADTDPKPAQPTPATNRPAFTPPVISPEIAPDRRVTFRLRAPNAKEVFVSGEFGGGNKAMAKDNQGVWSVTVGPLEPELYGYGFSVDGMRMPDPGNALIKPMRAPLTSILDLPGEPPLPHDFKNVPHGTVRAHWYQSKALGLRRSLHVYTPPDYDRDPSARYPVLYLFHGSGDNDGTWTVLGRAHLILDNLLAESKARPMVIVMTDGHAAVLRVTGAVGTNMISRNVEAFQSDLLGDVLPFVEANYRVRAGAASRAIAGLSMGGGQSLTVGLNHPELFAWIGGFSSYLPNPETTAAAALNDPKGSNEKFRLLWIACGKEDRLLDNARKLSDTLKQKEIRHEFIVTDGGHSWPVWRKYLAQFAPLLFTAKK